MGRTTLAHLKRLVGNPDAYAVQTDGGKYYPVERPGPDARAWNLAFGSALEAHLRGDMTLGTYVINPPELARTLVFDIDDLHQGDPANPQSHTNKIVRALRGLGVPSHSIGVVYSGRKGFHVWLLLWDYVQASELRHLGRITLLQAEVECEVFPKQDRVPEGGLGNLVKLPGGIHRVTGNRSDYVTPLPQPMSVAVWQRLMKKLPPLPELKRNGERPVALECMANIQAGIEEGGRNRALFQFCAHLRRSSVDEHIVETAALAVNSRFKPPLDPDEVWAVVQSSRDKGPICRQLSEDIRCADCPVLREKGLYTKPGQIREGAEGELVVVQVAKKDGGFVTLQHPDLSAARGTLK